MTKEKTAPLGHGVDKEDGINGSLEEAIIGAKGVSGITEENSALLNHTISKEPEWGKNGASVEGQFQDETAWRKKKTYIKHLMMKD